MDEQIEKLKQRKKKLETIEQKKINEYCEVMKKKKIVENKNLEQNFATCVKNKERQKIKTSTKKSMYTSNTKTHSKSPNLVLNSVDNLGKNQFSKPKYTLNEYDYEIDLPPYISKKSLM